MSSYSTYRGAPVADTGFPQPHLSYGAMSTNITPEYRASSQVPATGYIPPPEEPDEVVIA